MEALKMLSCLSTGLLFKRLLIFLCVQVFFLHTCVYIMHMCVSGVQGGQKRSLGALELELCVVVNHHVDAGNQTWVLCGAANVPDP